MVSGVVEEEGVWKVALQDKGTACVTGECHETVWSVLVIELRVTWKVDCGEMGSAGTELCP